MKPITREISLTLLLKLTLLFLVWFYCFKGTHKPIKDTREWFLGDTPIKTQLHKLKNTQ